MKIKLTNIGIEFIFDLKNNNPSKKSRFFRELYGWKSPSNNNKYLYIKEGFLSDIKHIKPARSTIIVSINNSIKLREFFKNNNIDFNEKIVILDKKNAEILGLNIPEDWEKIYSGLINENISLSAYF